MRHVDDAERRARLARRHAIAPAHRVETPEQATAAVGVLHATEPASVYLSVAARTDATVADVDRALYDDRSLVKQLAMRRTLFVFPRELLPAAWGSASTRVAGQQRQGIAKDLVAHGIAEDPQTWIDEACAAVLEHLDSLGPGAERSARQLREALPQLEGRTTADPTKKWDISAPIAPRVLTLLGARAELVRGHNDGHWRTSRPLWTRTESWLGSAPEPPTPEAGYAVLVTRWLAAFGPGTEADLVWWLGATKSAVRRALADVGAVTVSLDGGGTGYLLPDDLDPAAEASRPVEPWAALLPVLDPTTMGWRDREFYLDPDLTPYLFDTNGNGGATCWWDGRVVGAWVQDADGVVDLVLRGDLGSDARAALQAEADRLTAWLDGVVIASVYKSALMKGERLP